MTHLHHWTPTHYSVPLSQHTGQQIWLKMECYQPSGSFKIRGIGKLCQHYAAQGSTRFVASSGGNAGAAAAYASRMLSIPIDVFVPTNTHGIFLQAIRNEGATVHIVGDSWQEANAAALAEIASSGAAYIPPFDHPLIWSGHATLIDEIVQDRIPTPDAIVVAVGGGGLACGVLEGLHQHQLSSIPLYTVETTGAASFAASVAQNQRVTLASIDTIATTLGAKQVAEKLFLWRQTHPMIPLIVNDQATVRAITQFVDHHKVLVEPSCGAALSVLYDQHPALAAHRTVLVVVCGGVGASLALLRQWQTLLGITP